MSTPPDHRAQLLKALQALQKTRQKLDVAEAARHEPIAVIGMACRFPGADSPEAFWELLKTGQDRVGPVPPARWDRDACHHPEPGTPGRTYVREGAFLESPIDAFDAAFFGLSPREAMVLDPQQRLLLEVAWEALERTGRAPAALRNSRTGVFVGMTPSEYLGLLGEADRSSVYATTGNSAIFAAGRLSYVLGLQGPSLVIDTACSASLIGVHLACESLRLRTSDLALAGGSHLMVTPQGHVVQSQLQALAPDGRCKTFDAAANGYGRGEGCGLVVLKRLSDAEADGDPILALIRGSATNHDGPSSGLTVPSATAQAALIRQALADGRVSAQDVGYIEAHGTGTKLGDPIEVRALATVFGERERTQPLTIGSVKANIGHLEEAAGVAGLIKVILSLQHGVLPHQLHFAHPNPHIDWLDGRLRVATGLSPWPAGQRIAGVSSFGLGGANAHVLVEQASVEAAEVAAVPVQVPDRAWHLLTLSARHPAALRALARRHAERLRSAPHTDLGDLCATAFTGRNHFNHRLALTADTAAGLLGQLQAHVDDPADAVEGHHGVVPGQGTPKIAFLFTGQGSQYLHMGRDLYDTEPVFRAVIARCEPVVQAELGRSLIELLYAAIAPEHQDLMTSHPCGQAANFALECALADLWCAWGVQPAMVLGHSLGDYAAAYAAGVLELEEGLRLVIERGRLMERARGRMVSAIATEAQARACIAGLEDVDLAAVNGPQSVVVSGGADSVARVMAALQAAGHTVRELAIPVAAHSPLLDPVLDAYSAALARVRLSPPRLPVISGMTGQRVTDELTDPAYWRRHLRQTVRFADGVATLHAQGCRLFLEIGPQATLAGMAGSVLDTLAVPDATASVAPLLLPSLRQGEPDHRSMLDSLGALYVRGVLPDWAGVDGQRPRRRLVLPTYPFQRSRHWVESALPATTSTTTPTATTPAMATPLVAGLLQGDRQCLLDLLGEGLTLSSTARTALPELVDLLLARQREQTAAACLDDLLYRLVWRDQGVWGRAAAGLAPVDRIAAALKTEAARHLANPALHASLQAVARLDAGCPDRVAHLFAQGGLPLREGACWTADEAARTLGVVPAHRRFFANLLAMLADAGMLAHEGEHWRVRYTLSPVDLPTPADPAAAIEGTLLARFAPQWLALLRGQAQALDLLFGDDTAARLYRETAAARMMNALVETAVSAALDTLPADHGVRVLEIGAGTGGTTDGLLDRLARQPRRVQYTFTDKGTAFVKQARARYAAHPFVHAQVLDIEQSPSIQGFLPGQFDVVVAANVLHATRDLRASLTHARSLLAPGGLLVLLEASAQRRWIDLTFGLTEGWWRSADERQGHPLLPTDAWRALLADCGFEVTTSSPEADMADGELGQVLLLARATTIAVTSLVQVPGRHWLILADEGGLGDRLATELRQRGDQPVLVRTSSAWRAEDGEIRLNPDDPQDFRRLLTLHPSLQGVLHLWGLDAGADDVSSAARSCCTSALHLVQALSEQATELPRPRLWLVTQDAQGVVEGDEVRGALQAPLWGLGQVIAVEHPELACVRIDLDGRQPASAQVEVLLAELATPAAADTRPVEDRIALRDGRRQVARLVRMDQRPAMPTATRLRAEASYLVTGGLGGIGLAVARWLVEHGARHLLLLGRRTPSPETTRELETLRALGATVRAVSADVGDRDALAAVLASIVPQQPLAGVLHAAAAADTTGLLHQTDSAQFAAVLRPKLLGAWHLDALTRDLPLDFFVCFSSITALTGDLGLGAYAAANSFLDALCRQRHAAGRPALSIDWGIWSEVGAATQMDARRAYHLQDQGHGRIDRAQGLAALGRLLGMAEPQAAVMPMDWAQHRRQAGVTPLFTELLAAHEPPADVTRPAMATEPTPVVDEATRSDGASPRQQFERCAPAERPAFLSAQVTGLVARVLRLPRGETLPADESLLGLGMDSLMAVELRNHLRRTWGADIPFARFLQGLSTQDLVAELLQRLDVPTVAPAPAGEAEWITGSI
ncbi:SDR family NAD(P)-dependent oxidoreductase [Sphaerotilus montanus]|uniref:Microcystin synthetase protein McyG n=1 Tax=Sphaerotilus montanus TaxID=522889 RepID=A0A7Y9R342_9BURK|nr:type I polyketide synthase [Sphaerotilus montanus]NYG35449.1 microcystin synthetase protein McyG [Sphaerotilus montanus]NZD57196.1 SDR family NAD(P)-dependent oxidoreductase [Sphaerotilus montanus]